jgi:hypothetical protein
VGQAKERTHVSYYYENQEKQTQQHILSAQETLCIDRDIALLGYIGTINYPLGMGKADIPQGTTRELY